MRPMLDRCLSGATRATAEPRLVLVLCVAWCMALVAAPQPATASEGSLDTSFAGTGKVVTSFAGTGYGEADAVAIDGQGRIVVAGWVVSEGGGNTVNFAVARYNENGSLDQTFGTGGEVTT